jgi:hypothetical protein
MALSNIDKKHADSLLLTLHEENKDYNVLECVKKNYGQYGKLKQLNKQMEHLKKEALILIEECVAQERLQKVECKCKKISGNTYHLYKNEKGIEYFSLIGEKEWHTGFKDEFLGSYYYDYDKTFEKLSMKENWSTITQ